VSDVAEPTSGPGAAAAAGGSGAPLRALLICHHDAPLHHEGIASWLAARAMLAGIVVVHEPRALLWRRLKRERKRVGTLRLLDVLAMRVYYRLRLAAADAAWQEERLAAMLAANPADRTGVPVLHTHSANSPEAEAFVRQCAPDVAIALYKSILKESVFTAPAHGTWVWHPGICPEYRNAHGCFWALAAGDLGKVGMTLLRIDRGVDTGPTYGYFTYDYDELRESHIRIQHRVVLENLEAVVARMADAVAGRAAPLDVSGRPSAVWGQPWLTRYLRWKLAARKRHREGRPRAGARAAVS